MQTGSSFNQDWLQNWQAKIAIRITSIILWTLSFISMVVAGILISQVRDNVERSQNIILDHLAYQIYQKTQQKPSFTFDDLRPILDHVIGHEYISAVSMEYAGTKKSYGQKEDNFQQISRTIFIPDPLTITTYTTPIDEIVRSKQIEIFMLFSTGIILLGGFIGLVIDKSVKKPFHHLESVAQQYTSGKHSVRANTDRHDEFGTLALFLNQMLDRISVNEQKLQNEVNEKTIAHEKIKQQRDALQQLTSELTQARDLANDANEAKTIFLANMSHELRTPLNAVIGYSELIKEAPENRNNQALMDDIDRILMAGKHLLRLINQVLDISKIETGKTELVIEAVPVKSLIQDIFNTLKPAFEKNNNRLKLNIESHIDVIYTDPTRIKQIFFNLLDNANKFTHNGDVELHMQTRNQQLIVSIKDSGIGIEPGQLKHIFDEFVQADTSTTRRYGGTGLGLSICRHLIQLMGGEINVSSTPGQGSIFTISIPLIQNKDQGAL